MAVRQKGIRTVRVTRDFVREFSQLPRFTGDRPLDDAAGKRRIQFLRSKLEDGLFHSPRWATAELEGQTYRVNGGHSSQMLLDLPEEKFPSNLRASIMTFECDSEQDLPELFDQFDRPENSRTNRDAHRAHKAVHSELAEISDGTTGVCTSGISYYLTVTGQVKGRVSRDARVRLVHQAPEFIRWFNGVAQSCPRLRRRGVIAAMYAMYQTDRDAAELFWTEVRNEDNNDPQSSTRRLSTYLREACIETKTSSDEKNRLSFIKSIHAANSWKTNTPTKLRVVKNAKIPKLRWSS